MTEGGLPMGFLLVLVLVTLASALSFAVRPSRRGGRTLRHAAHATLLATAVGVVLDAGATLHHAGQDMAHERRVQIVVVGLAESTAPAIVGLGALAVVSLLRAVGTARRASSQK